MIYEKYTGDRVIVTLKNSPNEEITQIGAKAFLSCKQIRQLVLPESIEYIGDWAFAHMQGLTDLTLPARPISFGKQVFLDCISLKQIHLTGDTSGNEGLPFLLGVSITILQDISLLRPEQAGHFETHAGWLNDFDRAVTAFITGPDVQGYEPVFYGWFNDEDADSTQLPAYLHKRRCQKLELAFLRLRYDFGMQPSLKQLLQAYLWEHLPKDLIHPSPTIQTDYRKLSTDNLSISVAPYITDSLTCEHTITWELLPQYCQKDATYIKILADTNVLTSTNIPFFLTHLQNACPEVIAFLLHLQGNLQEKNDFFVNFAL